MWLIPTDIAVCAAVLVFLGGFLTAVAVLVREERRGGVVQPRVQVQGPLEPCSWCAGSGQCDTQPRAVVSQRGDIEVVMVSVECPMCRGAWKG